MKEYIVINNYMVGTKLQTMPQCKIIKKERIDSKHVRIEFENLTDNERLLIKKLTNKELREVI